MPRLIVHPGEANEQAHDLEAGSNRIGRALEAEISIADASLSRLHASLELTDGGAVLVDLDSKNGTFVDGARIDRRPLRGGETLRCGQVTLFFDHEAEEDATSTLHGELDPGEDPSQLSISDLIGPSQAGTVAVHLASLDPESRAQTKLKILLKVSQMLSSPEGIDRLPERILDLAFDLLDIDRAAILLVDESSGELEERVRRVRPGLPRSGRIYSEYIVRHVCERGVAALFSNAQDDPRLEEARSVFRQSIRSSICAPLKERDAVLGLLYVDNLSTPDSFTDDDLEFLSAFANQAAVAVQNARLYTRLEREAIQRSNLMRFFPPEAVGRILESPEPTLEPRETEVTTLFSDISGFTAMSTGMSPRALIGLLNRYFPAMADIVFEHGGMLEKYIGDALLAIWGAPYAQDDDADRAVRTAVAMQRALGELNENRGDHPELAVHIGLNTGRVAAGNIGSDRYLQYATIGDATNVAARICGVARPGEILVSETTVERLGEQWPVEPLAPVEVKGKDEPLRLYRLDWAGA